MNQRLTSMRSKAVGRRRGKEICTIPDRHHLSRQERRRLNLPGHHGLAPESPCLFPPRSGNDLGCRSITHPAAFSSPSRCAQRTSLASDPPGSPRTRHLAPTGKILIKSCYAGSPAPLQWHHDNSPRCRHSRLPPRRHPPHHRLLLLPLQSRRFISSARRIML